jgi:hypothetical protein
MICRYANIIIIALLTYILFVKQGVRVNFGNYLIYFYAIKNEYLCNDR